jgi:hypothetical protein
MLQLRNTGAPAIPYNTKGILVTCEGGRERRSGDEVVSMIEEVGPAGWRQQLLSGSYPMDGPAMHCTHG